MLLYKNQLFFLRNEEWLNIKDLTFKEEHVGRLNLNLTFCIFDENKNLLFAENNWLLKDPHRIKKIIAYNLRMTGEKQP